MALGVENLNAEKARYDVGRSTLFDVLARQDALRSAQIREVRARIDYLKGRSMVDYVTGDLMTRYGLAASIWSEDVNLALDITWRFDGLPHDFYRDWIGVAREEAGHFELLLQHLQTMGFSYGDYAAHNGLWEMAEKTSDDLLARLALVPLSLIHI